MKKINHLKIGRKTIRIEAKGLDNLSKSIDNKIIDKQQKPSIMIKGDDNT